MNNDKKNEMDSRLVTKEFLDRMSRDSESVFGEQDRFVSIERTRIWINKAKEDGIRLAIEAIHGARSDFGREELVRLLESRADEMLQMRRVWEANHGEKASQ